MNGHFLTPGSLGGTEAWCTPRLLEGWGQRPRRHLCWGTMKPGWASSPALPSLPATRPGCSGRFPDPLHAAQTAFHDGNAFSPLGQGGGGAPGGLSPQSRRETRDAQGTGPREPSPPRRGQPSRRARRGGRRGGREARIAGGEVG